ncbi:hypothetical protein KAI56_00820 [Candidatus Parcubacteria bacterium]|nr:hypothetical protein [Candidatus Parcubacteria bacterium]
MISNLEKYKKDLKQLIKNGNALLVDLTKNKDKASVFNSSYQRWYSEAQEVMRQILSNRSDEFNQLYCEEKRKNIDSATYTIKDWLLGIRASMNEFTGEKRFEDFGAATMRFQSQLSILKSAEARFESSLFDIKQLVQADLFDSELDIAKELNKKGFARGAGAVAGVVLESHLLQVCENHRITIRKKNPGINDLSQLLKDNDVIDIPEWRKIQHLADLRNLCDHKKKIEPKKEDIDELIDGVSKIIKTLF